MSNRNFGILLVTIATVMWSTAGLFVRMLDLDVWTVLGWRSVFAGATLLLIAFFQHRKATPADQPASIGLYLLAGLVSGVSMYAYIGSLKLTTVANVLALYATLPFVSAGIAFLWIGERSQRRVIVASGIAFVGVLIVAGFAARPQDVAGSALALFMTVTFSVLLVMGRRYTSLRLALVNAIGCGFCILLCLPLMSHTIPSTRDLAVLALFGATTSGIGYLLFVTGGRYVPSGEAGLIALLDVVLGPLWVYLAFDERPGLAAMLGSGLILFSVVWYLWRGIAAGKAKVTTELRPADLA